ncbi:CPBP family intramembrane glutamic endopeptidase [Flavihumibacter sp. ZG627]|uniref:CPBP family intramembrane glutamic endopeptidase n=1 Tax=Flavihumibacter sp. ZG627 TaxID=1463156 RepID=UPI00057EA5AE|nr:type II CAAX endopeptidase family protein [Flavihumibacter sp. ZG627]KIC90501.1 hypothetical protein HY58_11140 [Flavihumibacter sp. ZG627]
MAQFVIPNNDGKLRNLWWVALFFLILAAFTIPLVLLSQHYAFELSIFYQVIIITVVSIVCQAIIRQPLEDLFGTLNINWIRSLSKGLLIGAALMLVPALVLLLAGVRWIANPLHLSSLLPLTVLFLAYAVSEELLFRGFIFQRLITALGEWPAQLIISGLFMLAHLDNPGMTGTTKILASINIFFASILFGLAFIKTRSLALPIGIHFMANWVQGILLGFGVSGNQHPGILKPDLNDLPVWLTGGNFGMEASVPGLVSVIITIVFLYKWRPPHV